MQDQLAREGLWSIEAARLASALWTGSGKAISRASIARAAGVNEGQLWRGLDGRAVTRVSTVARAAGGLLQRIIQESVEEDFSVADNWLGRVTEAAESVARAVAEAVSSAGDANARRRLKARLERLDPLLESTVKEFGRAEKALAHLAHAWLADPLNDGLRLGVVGAAIAIRNARAGAGRAGAPESAHV